jgi:cell fate (sporulation/competence/biofilm development) regulator YlbF (YheA/YmcA/DUF963 family)
MSFLLDDSNVMVQTRGLCEAIANDSYFQQLSLKMSNFMSDDEARLQYQNVNQLGEELHHKQYSGIELTSREIREFEEARDTLLANDTARGYLEAQRELETLQRSVTKYVSLTVQLGHAPSAEDIANASSGCCGGGCGGGGSCSTESDSSGSCGTGGCGC